MEPLEFSVNVDGESGHRVGGVSTSCETIAIHSVIR